MVRGVAAYKKVGNQSAAEFASPHRLIQMLLEGALEKMVIAKGLMERNDIQGKGENISWAIRIIGGLQASLDGDKGGEVAETLGSLYTFVVEHLAKANADNDTKKIDECITIIRNIKEGWDGISEEAEKLNNQQAQGAE
ncbi:MAG: flagellar export chaperone FliS [Gammaproteobacteria bacterium]|nr:flagellar export chaperone FliS [Gammaproteobacteria bacterium]NNJ71730.1 flagellar export chaperone FliS [Enterobacterales bacterium]